MILVVQIGKIGDMILTTPLFSELKRLFPNSHLEVLASEVNKAIALNSVSTDETLVFHKNFFKNTSLVKLLFNKIDLWIDTKDNYSKTSEILLKFFKPKVSLGFNYDKKIFDIDLNDYRSGNHAVEINLSPINYFDKKYSPANSKLSFNIPDNISKKVDLFFKNFVKRKVLINISAGNISRYLRKEQWLDIITKINSQHVSSFILISLDKDRSYIDYIQENGHNIDIKYINTKNILEVAEVVKMSDIIITADTSLVHICSTFNKPLVALYPNVKWNLEKFAPLTSHSRIIVSNNEKDIKDIESDNIVEKFLELRKEIDSGNAESRTRVRKEDH